MSVHLLTPRERAVCQWESALDSRDTRTVDLPTARAVVQHVWREYGLPGGAPNVVELFDKDAEGYISGAWASMGPTCMTLYKPCNTVTLLHELAHAMCEDPLDQLELRPAAEREMHGDIWLSIYVDLLDRFMGPSFNKGYLMATLQPLARLGINPTWCARPWHTRNAPL